MRRLAFFSLFLLPLVWSCRSEPRLDADSLFALHESTKAMKEDLGLSASDVAALEGAIDVLVGDATRELLTATETLPEPPDPMAQAEAEARVLAPIDGLTFPQLITTAADATDRELEALLADLSTQEAVAAEHQKRLDDIRVVRAGYGMSLATRRSWVDVTIHNGTDQRLHEVLLDCRLVDRGTSTIREQGTCAAVFAEGLGPGLNGIAQTYVGWDSESRESRVLEAWPIRAYGAHRTMLWQVPSQLNPLEAGQIGDIKSRVAVLDSSLRTLKSVTLPAED
jgi:hypothetical protein